jgi:hypothetical protein
VDYPAQADIFVFDEQMMRKIYGEPIGGVLSANSADEKKTMCNAL